MGVVLPTSEKFADRFHLGICRWRMHLRPSLSIPMISPISWPLDMRRWWKFGARSREWGTLFADRGWVKGYLFGIASGICSPPQFRLAQVVPQVSLIFPFVLSFWFALFETMPCPLEMVTLTRAFSGGRSSHPTRSSWKARCEVVMEGSWIGDCNHCSTRWYLFLSICRPLSLEKCRRNFRVGYLR